MQHPQWQGSIPQRFSGGRKHMGPENQISLGMSLSINKQAKNGIRTFSPSPTPQAVFKPHQKIFDDRYNVYTKNIDLKGIKRVQLPQQKERIRPERLHVVGGRQTDSQIDLRGIRSFHEANKSRDQHFYVENQMQRKGKLYGLESMRNSLGVTSMGDKPYKYPEYEANFYKNGGLIPGSTHKPRIGQIAPEIKKGSVLTKPMWDVRKEKQYLDSIDQWEQTILKENNPNWKDPDDFLAAGNDTAPKDPNPKKGGKK